MTVAASEAFAPAKINLALHVTGVRADGYHLLDSLVVFADLGDRVRVVPAREMSLAVTGPMAAGVPEDSSNLCWKAAEAFGEPVAITLEKHLPSAAGIGGGSSDAAAVLRAMERLFDRPFPGEASALGADVPVCLAARAARMQGIGEELLPVNLPKMHAVLVNPQVSVPTPMVFRALSRKDNAPLSPLPEGKDVLPWLKAQRNDLQTPACTQQPVISVVLEHLSRLDGARLVRMSGSGATCFALFDHAEAARRGADELSGAHSDWWIRAAVLH